MKNKKILKNRINSELIIKEIKPTIKSNYKKPANLPLTSRKSKLRNWQQNRLLSSSHFNQSTDKNLDTVKIEHDSKSYTYELHKPIKIIDIDLTYKGSDLSNFVKLSPKTSLVDDLNSDKFEGATSKIPKVHFKICENYPVRSTENIQQTKSYYRFIERTIEEIDQDVDYDIEEEDICWLETINKLRFEEGLDEVYRNNFELIMDKLEKLCYLETKTKGTNKILMQHDEDAICCVCSDGDCLTSNVILFCDLCNLAVHQECYGVPYIPEGPWICRRCLLSPSEEVSCCLCPSKIGAFKQTDNGRWAHIICALWLPDVGFANGVFLEPIDGLNKISPARWKLICCICKKKGVGACVQCHKLNCYTSFHVSCAQLIGFYLKIETMTKIENSTQLNKRYIAFCDIHTPKTDNLNNNKSINFVNEDNTVNVKDLDNYFGYSILSFPKISMNSLKEIERLIECNDEKKFLNQVKIYWLLKRQSRKGVPLISNSLVSNFKRNNSKDVFVGLDGTHLNENRIVSKRLRQELEKLRLLNELIRKREKLKFEKIKLQEEEMRLNLQPFIIHLLRLIDELIEITPQQFFGIEKIENISDKIKLHVYKTIDEFKEDFSDLFNNISKSRKKSPQKYKEILSIKFKCFALIEKYGQIADESLYCQETGLHSQ